MIVHACLEQKIKNSSKNRIHRNKPSNKFEDLVEVLKPKGQKLVKNYRFSVKMWVGPQILEEKICIFGKKIGRS